MANAQPPSGSQVTNADLPIRSGAKRVGADFATSAYNSIISLIIGAVASMVVVAITRPDTETAKIDSRIDALSLAAVQKINPKAGYTALKRTYAKGVTVGLAGETAYVNVGNLVKRECGSDCKTQPDIYLSLVGPARKNLIDAIV